MNFRTSRTLRWSRSPSSFATTVIARRRGPRPRSLTRRGKRWLMSSDCLPSVTYHIGVAGGAFGRRGTLDEHLEREVAAIAKRLRGVPVKLIWTREDDVQGGYYRPMVAHRVEVSVDDGGMPSAWRHVVVGQGIVLGTPFEAVYVKDGVEELLLEGTADMRYAIPNFQVSAHHPVLAGQYSRVAEHHRAIGDPLR